MEMLKHAVFCFFKLESGADINFVVAQPEDSWTPLMYAAGNSLPNITALLLQAGADVNKKNRKGQKAVDISKSNEVTNLLNAKNPLIAGLPPTDAAFCGDPNQPKEVFISFNGTQIETARNIAKKIQSSLSVTVWLDEGQFEDYNLPLIQRSSIARARMDKAMRQSKVVVALISNSYHRSPSKQREMCLADGLKKPIVSALVDHDATFPPEGPIGPIVAPEVVVNVLSDTGALQLDALTAAIKTKLQAVA